jgi:hypothetical protein
MTVITIVKTLPVSQYYTGSGPITINVLGANNLVLNCKKNLIKIQRAKTRKTQTDTPSDIPDTSVIDLKRCDENIRVSGYLEDDSSGTAWNKLWQLRGMVTTGGKITSLTIGTAAQLVFGTTLQDVFLESITGTVESDDTGDISNNIYSTMTPGSGANDASKAARIRIELNFYIGKER